MGLAKFNHKWNRIISDLFTELADVEQELMVDEVSAHAYLTDDEVIQYQKQKELLLAKINEINQEIKKENETYNAIKV